MKIKDIVLRYTKPIKMNKNKRLFNQGFTLIEIITALVVFLVGFLGILALFPLGLDSAGRSAGSSQAAIIGIYLLDEISQMYQSDFNNTAKTFSSYDSDFSYKINVAEQITDYLKEITLSVYWNDKGVQQEERFVTYVAEYE